MILLIKNNIYKIFLGTFISLVCLFLLFKIVDSFDKTLESLTSVSIFYLAIGFLIYFLSLFLRTYRWKILFKIYIRLKSRKTQNRFQKTKKHQHNKCGKYKRSKRFHCGLCLHKRMSYELIDLFNNRELPTTETELKDIAAAAITGCNKIPYAGYNAPAARGIPKTL